MSRGAKAECGTIGAVRMGGATARGDYRDSNQDFFHIDVGHRFAMVLDGLGAAGDAVSRCAANAVAACLRSRWDSAAPDVLLVPAVRAGHDAVTALGQIDRDIRNCGATVVLVAHRDGCVHVSWLGDSPALLVSKGRVEKLTWDHDYRTITMRKLGMSEAEAREHRWKNVLVWFLGNWPDVEPLPEVISRTPCDGDRLILATDGVTNVLDDSQLLEACRAVVAPEACATHLVQLALDRGSRDNATCVVMAFGEGEVCGVPVPHRRWWQFWR